MDEATIADMKRKMELGRKSPDALMAEIQAKMDGERHEPVLEPGEQLIAAIPAVGKTRTRIVQRKGKGGFR